MAAQTRVYRAMADAGVSLDMFTPGGDGMVFTSRGSLELVDAVLDTLGLGCTVKTGLAKVTLVGAGMHGVPGVMARLSELLDEAGVPSTRRLTRTRPSPSWSRREHGGRSTGPARWIRPRRVTMRPLILLLTASLDGFIADREGGSTGSPPCRRTGDYLALMDSIDMPGDGQRDVPREPRARGRSRGVRRRDTYVFTSRDDLPPYPGVTFVHDDAVDFTAALKQRAGGAIWLFGGGKLATSLSDAGLVDDYFVALQPILLGDGVPLWVTPHGDAHLISSVVARRPGQCGIATSRRQRP